MYPFHYVELSASDTKIVNPYKQRDLGYMGYKQPI